MRFGAVDQRLRLFATGLGFLVDPQTLNANLEIAGNWTARLVISDTQGDGGVASTQVAVGSPAAPSSATTTTGAEANNSRATSSVIT